MNLAQHKLMSKAFAALRLTAPTNQRKVEATLRAIQKHASGLVFGKRWWLTERAATQPRSALGVGHLHVANYMQAAWAQPLLDAMGRTTEDRPYKHYFAHYARQAYPDLGMGREMLSLNLSFSRIVDGPPEAMPGEARQAFKAVAALPPLRYAAPDPDAEPACQPREDLPREDLLAQYRRAGRPIRRPALDAPGGPCVPRQRPVGRVEGVGSGGLRGGGGGEGGAPRRGASGGGRWAHIDRSIATVPAHAHPQTSLAGVFLRRFFHCRRWCVP